MTRVPPIACLCLAIGAAALLPAGAPAQVQQEKANRARALREGTHAFRRILFDHGLEALESYDQLARRPTQTVFIVLGDLAPLGRVPGGLEAFVRSGGAVLIASDRPVVDEAARRQLQAVAGVSIQAETLVCKAPWDCYRQLEYCPVVRPAPGATPNLFEPPRGRALGGMWPVAANIPSMLLPRGFVPGVGVLAHLPPGCGVARPGRLDLLGYQPAFAVGGDVGKGRVLVFADHSLFINEMMLPRDTGNVEFAYNCVAWLQGESRNRALFVENGRIQTEFEIPLRSAAIPPEEIAQLLFDRRNELLVQAESGLAGVEESGWFDRALLEGLSRVGLPPYRLLRLLALLGTLAVLLFLIYRLGIRHRFRHDTSVPTLATALGRNLPVAPLVDQRQHTLLAGGNVYEPAARLVRAWFARLGVEVGSAAPAFEVRGGWWQARKLRRRLAQLWRLACGLEPVRVGPTDLWRLERELEALRQGWQRGQWRVLPPASPARPGVEARQKGGQPRPKAMRGQA